MKYTDDFEGIIYGQPTGLSKYVYANTRQEDIRKGKRKRKVMFSQQLAREKNRKERQKVSEQKRRYPEEEKFEQISDGDVFLSTSQLNVLTEEEEKRLLALDKARQAVEDLERKEAYELVLDKARQAVEDLERKEAYELVLDVKLAFPEEDEQ